MVQIFKFFLAAIWGFQLSQEICRFLEAALVLKEGEKRRRKSFLLDHEFDPDSCTILKVEAIHEP